MKFGPGIKMEMVETSWPLGYTMMEDGIHKFKYPGGVEGIEYWKDNELHRTNGPAVEINIKKKWYQFFHPVKRIYEYYEYGVRHRYDGPAIDNGKKSEWWIKGEQFNITQFCLDYGFTLPLNEEAVVILKMKYE